MAGGADQGIAGPKAICPRCATEVLQKAMIPVGVTGTLPAGSVNYLCNACARTELRTASVAP